ncbi:MAG TPA: hypothetical protein VFG89_06965, partial [Coriobacteriia bacterium]|nr:hypothetical protein [Coriobacteriia bacterium]
MASRRQGPEPNTENTAASGAQPAGVARGLWPRFSPAELAALLVAVAVAFGGTTAAALSPRVASEVVAPAAASAQESAAASSNPATATYQHPAQE